MNRTIFLTGVLLGVMAVLLGAYGAHGLENLVEPDAIKTFETGVKYQMYHALLLLILGATKQLPEPGKKLIYYLVLTGILLFSFSIYLLALNSLSDFDFRVLVFLTPIGGMLLILGWSVLGYRAFKHFN